MQNTYLADQKFIVKHDRKGTFKAVAQKDFNIDDEWYPLILVDDEVKGLSKNKWWGDGDEIPCRKSFCELTPVDNF